jgi:hypothetical protein
LYLWITIIEIISITLNVKSDEFKNLITKFSPFKNLFTNLWNLVFFTFLLWVWMWFCYYFIFELEGRYRLYLLPPNFNNSPFPLLDGFLLSLDKVWALLIRLFYCATFEWERLYNDCNSYYFKEYYLALYYVERFRSEISKSSSFFSI